MESLRRPSPLTPTFALATSATTTSATAATSIALSESSSDSEGTCSDSCSGESDSGIDESDCYSDGEGGAGAGGGGSGGTPAADSPPRPSRLPGGSLVLMKAAQPLTTRMELKAHVLALNDANGVHFTTSQSKQTKVTYKDGCPGARFVFSLVDGEYRLTNEDEAPAFVHSCKQVSLKRHRRSSPLPLLVEALVSGSTSVNRAAHSPPSTHTHTHTHTHMQIAAGIDATSAKVAKAVIAAKNLSAAPSAISRALQCTLDQKYGTNEDNFRVLPALLAALQQKYNAAFTFEVQPVIPQGGAAAPLEWFGFVMPYATAAMQHGLGVWSVDGAHYRYRKNELGGTWLFCVQLLASGSYVLISASYHAEAEGLGAWGRHFAMHARHGLMDQAPSSGWVLVSDQDKGLLSAIAQAFTRDAFISSLCAIHVVRNGADATGVRSREVQAGVIAASRAPTEAAFMQGLEAVRKLGSRRDGAFEGGKMVDWLQKHHPEHNFAAYMTPSGPNSPNFGVCTSNLGESFNGVQSLPQGARSVPLAAAVGQLVASSARSLAKERQLAMMPVRVPFCGEQASVMPGPFADRLVAAISKADANCSAVTATPTPHVFHVQSQSGVMVEHHVVDMRGSGTCTCLLMAQYSMPCYHYLCVVYRIEDHGGARRYSWLPGLSPRHLASSTIAICEAAGDLATPSFSTLLRTEMLPHRKVANRGRPVGEKRKRSHRSKDARIKSHGEVALK